MATFEIPEEDKIAIREILLRARESGDLKPLLPLNVDIDGDGIVDSWGLDENDEVVLVSGVDIDFTVYVSEGDDVGGA